MQSFSSFSSSSCFVCLISLNGAGGLGGSTHHITAARLHQEPRCQQLTATLRAMNGHVSRTPGSGGPGARSARGAGLAEEQQRHLLAGGSTQAQGAEPVTPHGESAGRGGTDVHSDRLVSAGQLYEGSW